MCMPWVFLAVLFSGILLMMGPFWHVRVFRGSLCLLEVDKAAFSVHAGATYLRLPAEFWMEIFALFSTSAAELLIFTKTAISAAARGVFKCTLFAVDQMFSSESVWALSLYVVTADILGLLLIIWMSL